MRSFALKCSAVISVLSMAVLCFTGLSFAQADETVLYSFGGYPTDGMNPNGGLLLDADGDIYGTTPNGGSNCQGDGGCGTVFELSPSADGWTETILYNFCTTGDPFTCADGANPYAGLVSDQSGNLFGTTLFGGDNGSGVVFELSPPAGPGGLWTETIVWTFGGAGDGAGPYQGKLNWDASGNLYGTTSAGGSRNHGTVFELSPGPNGTWTEAILHSFDGSDGADPLFGVAIDKLGNLYGTANVGGIVNGNSYCSNGCGTVFELSPSGGTWKETVLVKFTGPGGARPSAPISIDRSGNLYGTLQYGGTPGCFATDGCGGVFKLAAKVGGGLSKYALLFSGQGAGNPESGVLVDEKTGSLFGTTYWGNNVYTITGRTESTVYQFCSLHNCADGSVPGGGLLAARDGQLYGVTISGGGPYNGGVIYSIAP